MNPHHSAKRYWVDWSDASFPRIRLAEEASENETLMNFTQAKKLIITSLLRSIKNMRSVINETRALRVRDVRKW